jgi:hypothetical protein
MGSIRALLGAARHRRSIAVGAFRATLAGLTGVHVQVEPIDACKLVGIVTDGDAVKTLARQVPALRRLAAG